MGNGDPMCRAAHLGLDHWNNIPEESDPHRSYNHDPFRNNRRLLYAKVVSFLLDLMAEHLTARQLEVMKLYHLEHRLTQDAVGQLLQITQPTVNRHLNGKRRRGKSVGGAYRRIRRQIYEIADSDDLSSDRRRIVHFLLSLDRSDIPLRERRGILFFRCNRHDGQRMLPERTGGYGKKCLYFAHYLYQGSAEFQLAVQVWMLTHVVHEEIDRNQSQSRGVLSAFRGGSPRELHTYTEGTNQKIR